jgi:CubicO group peptidase (beta-lactamase class C family)
MKIVNHVQRYKVRRMVCARECIGLSYITLVVFLGVQGKDVIAQGRLQSDDGVVVHPYTESDVMQGSPPTDANLVTRANFQSTHDRLRWAVQHWRELYPTVAVTRGDAPLYPLPRIHREVVHKALNRLDGSKTTVLEELERLDVDAFVALHNGSIVSEHYFHGMRPDTPHFLASVNKSIVSTVISTLVADGTLQTEKTIEFYVPELKNTAYAGAKLGQILNMLSAVEYNYDGDPATFALHEKSIMPEAAHLGGAVGEQEFIMSLPPRQGFVHGQGMMYKETDPGVLVWAAEKASGKRFQQIASERFWSKIGAEFPMEVVVDSQGHWTFHISAAARDLARWSQMLLSGGSVNGQQVVPVEFIDRIRTEASVERLKNSPLTGELFPAGVGYGNFFYRDTRNHDALAAAGAFGQFCYVSPKHSVALVILSSADGWEERLQAGMKFEDLFAEDVAIEADRWHLCREICMLISDSED